MKKIIKICLVMQCLLSFTALSNSKNTIDTWYEIKHQSSAQLYTLKNETNDPIQKAWYELAIITKANSINIPVLSRQLISWQERYPEHPGNQLLPDKAELSKLQKLDKPKHIAVLIPQRGPYASMGKLIKEGILNAYFSDTSKANLQFYDTSKSVEKVYQQAISEGADFIIGPLLKNDVQKISKLKEIKVTTLALNLSAGLLPDHFYEYGLFPEDEAVEMAIRASQSGYKNALIIAPHNDWGKRLSASFKTQWLTNGGKIKATFYFGNKTDFTKDVARLLKINLNVPESKPREDFDVIFLFAFPKEAKLIVPLIKFYYENDVPIFASAAIYSGKKNLEKENDINGVIICDIPWKKQRKNKDRFYAIGQDAYLLSQTFPRMQQLPDLPLYGATGALTLSNNQQFHRTLPCLPIRNGKI